MQTMLIKMINNIIHTQMAKTSSIVSIEQPPILAKVE